MCIVSMVYDYYQDRFPSGAGQITIQPYTQTWIPSLQPDVVSELRQLIAEFRAAVAAARVVDRLTGQPDCDDPEKRKLEARVAELELQLAEKPKRGRKPRAKK